MASLVVVLALTLIPFGVCVGAFLRVSFAIRREDSSRSLQFDAPSRSAMAARTLVGVTGSRWE